MSIKENLDIIKQNVAAACCECGRNPEDVLILAVTKTRSAEEINEATGAYKMFSGILS